MGDIPKEDLERIEKKLESIEQKIGSKWALPIIVALISGVIGLATVVIQIRLEHSSSEKRIALERKYKEDTDAWSENKLFHSDAISLVEKINALFKRACLEPNFKEADALNSSCTECFTLIDTHRHHYGEDKDFLKKMREYNDLVQGTLTDFESGKNIDKKQALESTKQKYEEVLISLGEFYKQYVNKPQSNGQ